MKRKNSHEKPNKKHSLLKTQITWRQNQQNRAFPAWFQSLSEPREQDNPREVSPEQMRSI